MHIFTLLALVLQLGHANEFHRGGLVFSGPDSGAPIVKDQILIKARENLQKRTLALIEKRELGFMMTHPKGDSPERVEYALEYHNMLPVELAANVMVVLAELEVRIADRYGITPARVAHEVDTLIGLARLGLVKANADTLEAWIVLNMPTLGAAFLDMYAAEVVNLYLPRKNLPKLKMIDLLIPNLGRHLLATLKTSRRLLSRHSSAPASQAWLKQPPPSLVPDLMPAVTVRETMPIVPGSTTRATLIDADSLASLIKGNACEKLFEGQLPSSTSTLSTDDQ